jgi:16S rRNA U1498 N3-methylase RsmE
VERDDLASLAGLFWSSAPFERGAIVRLDEDAAHHLRVRRLEPGDRVYLADGAGSHATGSIVRLG